MLCISEIKSCIEYLEEEKNNHLQQKPNTPYSAINDSHVETVEYIDVLKTKIN